jgi:hypothetical protein
MAPTLLSGDTVTVHRRRLADVLPGEVVVFARNRYFVAHRVVRRLAFANDMVVVTRGDAQSHDDPPVAPEEFLGVVTAVYRAGVNRPLRREPSPMARWIAWMVRHSSFVRSFLDRLNAAVRRTQGTSPGRAPAAPARSRA